MGNWRSAPLDPPDLQSSHTAQIIASCLRNESCKNELCFALLGSASSNIYFHDTFALAVFILILCTMKKERKDKRFLFFEIHDSLLFCFRVPSRVCVWFSFVSSCYHHPLRKTFCRELFLDNPGILLYLNYDPRLL